MKQKTTSIIFLMENEKVAHRITLEDIDYYKFTFDNNILSSLIITSSNVNIKDLELLSTHPYESYVVMAEKKIEEKKNKISNFNVSAIVYKRMALVDDNGEVTLTFWGEQPSRSD